MHPLPPAPLLLPRFLPLLRAASNQPYLRSCREDAFQIAALAFLQAARTYDPARGPAPAASTSMTATTAAPADLMIGE